MLSTNDLFWILEDKKRQLNDALTAAKELREELLQNTSVMWTKEDGFCWCGLTLSIDGPLGPARTAHYASCERKRNLINKTAWLEKI